MRTPPGAAELGIALEQRVDQLVVELAAKWPLPVVAVVAVGRVEDPLLLHERVRPQAVVEEPGAERSSAQLVPDGGRLCSRGTRRVSAPRTRPVSLELRLAAR